jgi:hypothetical protein
MNNRTKKKTGNVRRTAAPKPYFVFDEKAVKAVRSELSELVNAGLIEEVSEKPPGGGKAYTLSDSEMLRLRMRGWL